MLQMVYHISVFRMPAAGCTSVLGRRLADSFLNLSHADRSHIFMVDGIIIVPMSFIVPCCIAFVPVLLHQMSRANLRIALNALTQKDLSESG